MYNDILTKAATDRSYVDAIIAIKSREQGVPSLLGYNPLKPYGPKSAQFRILPIQDIELIVWRRKVVVPLLARTNFLRGAHGVHLGHSINYNRVAVRYWWPGMRKDFKQFTQQCTFCSEFDRYDSFRIANSENTENQF